jgi:TonB family protein
MSAAGESAPASRSPRRTPSIIRLTPQFISRVCTQQQGIGQSRTGVEFRSMGFLFGSVTERLVSVHALKSLTDDECDRICSSEYRRRGDVFERLLAASKADPELLSLNLVGWFSTRFRSGLRESDIEFHNRYFRRASDVALVLKPEQSSELSAELYARSLPIRLSTDNYRSAWLRLSVETPPAAPIEVPIPGPVRTQQAPGSVPLDELAPGVSTAEAEPLSVGKAARVPAAAAKPKQRLPWVRLGAVAAVVIIAVLSLWQMKSGKGIATLSTVRATQPDGALDLRATRRGDALLVTWNRRSPAAQSAMQGVLRIKDGSQQHEIHLDRAHIASGTVLYDPTSGDVVFRLEMRGKDGTNAESTRVLDGRKLALASSSSPEPASHSLQPGNSAHPVTERADTPDTRRKTDRSAKPVRAASPISPPASPSFRPATTPFVPLLNPSSKTATSVQNASAEARIPATAAKESGAPAEGKPSPTTQPQAISKSIPASAAPQATAPPTPVPQTGTSTPSQAAQSHTVAGSAGSQTTAPPVARTQGASVTAVYVPPRPLRQVMPETQSLRALVYKIVEIAVEVTIDQNGRVTAARIVKSDPDVNLALAGAAISAAKQWRYEPATLRGQNIISRQTIVFQFHPRQ